MSLFSSASPRQVNLALTILRVVTGIIFIAHGGQKLFVFGFEGVGAGFAQMGVPMPGVVGPFIALVEFFGGVALILGLLTRVVAVGLAFTMVGAILLVHLAGGFFMPTGIEFTLSLLAASVALAITGAGGVSLDRLIERRRHDAAATTSPEHARVRQAA